jgi:hypothetical protein
MYKPTPFDVGLHYCSSDYIALWLSTRFVWQLSSSWSCCHGNRIRPSLLSSQQQRTRYQSSVIVLPGYNRSARFVGETVTHPRMFIDRHTLPSYQDLRFALVTCGGLMSLGLLTRSIVRVVISFLFNFIHLFNDIVICWLDITLTDKPQGN